MCSKMAKKSFLYKKDLLYILMFFRSNFLNYKFLFVNKTNHSPFFNLSDFLKSMFDMFFWLKVRILYYVNNWVYTTNHKRIAVNYFWFVILSGIVGMVLATLIRLEFAYPGVGVFAGDSLQYLSMATAHGVIMVFFMIMPLLLGAFANFLIPTQLGVHDVAFPRLNSAAFWFLPGGLLMLCQLVCIDRRYQRMNCFNIREIQSILKRKFFVDLINSHDHHSILNKTAMGLRFKTNSINSINSNMFIFYNYGIEFTPKTRTNVFSSFSLININSIASFNINSFFFNFVSYLNNFNFFKILNNLFLNIFNFSSLTSSINFLYLNFLNFFLYTLFSIWNFNFSSLNFLILNFTDFFNLLSSFFKSFSFFFKSFANLDSFYALFLNFFNNSIFNFNYFYFNNITFSTFNFNLTNFYLNPFNIVLDFFFILDPLFNFNFLNFNTLFLFNTNFNLYNLFNFSTLSTLFNFSQNPSFSNLPINNTSYDINNISLKKSFFNDSFYFKFDYNSYFVYIYLLIDFIKNTPFLIFNILSNFFNFFYLNNILFSFYSFVTTWYLPTLLNDNLFYIFFKNLNFYSFNLNNFHFYDFIINLLNLNSSFFKINFFTFKINYFFENILSFFNFLFINCFLNFFNWIFNILSFFNFFIFGFNSNSFFNYIYNLFFSTSLNKFNNSKNIYFSNYTSKYFNNTDSSFITKYTNEEVSDSSRFLRFYNPVFKYDYKSGDYFSKTQELLYSHLFTTISDITSSVRTSPWFFSESYLKAFTDNFSNYFNNITNTLKFKSMILHQWDNKRFNNTDAFYNFFYTLSNDFNFTNKKWIALNSLNQKFYRMFNTSSMQQRIYSNWRQLKFTREAWRCKLLAARHQKTLFRRYVHEDGVFWSIERNAKDLLPGWAMITPFSSRTRFTAIGKTDIGLMGVFLVLNSSIISAANFLVTYRYLSTLNNRKMRDARVFFTESIIVANWMMIFANPMLAIAILMLLSDRHWQTSFFDYSGGGDTVLFQHMFWFFGHPEVYIIIIPTFGFVNSMISYYLRKRVSARASLMYSMYTIAFLGFFVWGHHMYMVGLAHTTRMLFSTLTVMISVPAATKIMHWSVTTVNSAIALELPLLFTFTFIFLFVSGGISGMCVAHTGMDVLFHDTFYVIGHFHVMLAGAAMFASFGAFYFYFPAIFGVKYSRIYAYLHYVYYLIGQLMTVIPMFWLGYAGMPRRVLDYPASMGGWHSVISAGHMLSVAGLMAFFIMIFDSLRQGRAVTRNTFGISRYNTRLNFYLYEISKISYVQQKGFFLFRFIKPTSIKLNDFNYTNFEPYETTLITYTFQEK